MAFFGDVVHSLHRLRNAPSFTFSAVLTLALGMGATTAMYSVIQAVLLTSLPFQNPDRLYQLREDQNGQQMSVAWPNFVDWRNQQRSFSALAAYQMQHFEFFDGSHTTLVRAIQSTSEFLPILGVKAEMGRVFTAADDKPGAEAVVLLGHTFWQNRLHADTAIVGKSINLSGKPYTVIGVLPASFSFFFGREDFYVPLGPSASDPEFNNRTAHGSLSVIGRLRDGVTLQAARTEMEGIAARLAGEYPATNAAHSVQFMSIEDIFFLDIRPVLWTLMAAVAFVLLVGCANVSNLLLARGADREREYAIRSALGANAYAIFRESISESLCLSLLAGLCGVLIASASLPIIVRLAPQNIPRFEQTGIRWPVLAFSFAVCLLISLLCGVLPAWAGVKVAPEQALRSYSSSSRSGRGGQRLRFALLAGGVAMTVVLSAAAGLMVQSLRRTLSVDPGFKSDHLLTLDVVLTSDRYKLDESVFRFLNSALEKVRALPGVTSAGTVCSPPLVGECGDYFYAIPGRTQLTDASLPDAYFNSADLSYFQTAGIRLLYGRGFLGTDTKESPKVIVINNAFARKWWPSGDAVGHSVLFGGRGEKGELLQVVGVVDDVKQQSGLDADVDPEMFFPFAQRPTHGIVLMLRTAGDPQSLSAAAENAIHEVDSEVPVRIHPMDYYVQESLRQRRFLTVLLSTFAALALFLAALGVFGVAAYAVASRKSEIAVRMALGAAPTTVKRWITQQIASRVAIGCVLGLAGVIAAARVLRTFVYGISPTDPLVLGATCVLLIAIAVLAAWIPARRAAEIDPMTTLRAE